MESYIDFGIKSDTLCVERITNMLGISPTNSYNPNERYIGKTMVDNKIVSIEKKRPSFGVWHYSTKKKIKGNSIERHACHLLKALKPAYSEIEKILKNKEYEIALSIKYIGHSGFALTSETLSRLTRICKNFYIYCFEENEINNDT